MDDAMNSQSGDLGLLISEAEQVRGPARGVRLQKESVVMGGGGRVRGVRGAGWAQEDRAIDWRWAREPKWCKGAVCTHGEGREWTEMPRGVRACAKADPSVGHTLGRRGSSWVREEAAATTRVLGPQEARK